jgi:hypothetical protein
MKLFSPNLPSGIDLNQVHLEIFNLDSMRSSMEPQRQKALKEKISLANNQLRLIRAKISQTELKSQSEQGNLDEKIRIDWEELHTTLILAKEYYDSNHSLR